MVTGFDISEIELTKCNSLLSGNRRHKKAAAVESAPNTIGGSQNISFLPSKRNVFHFGPNFTDI